MPGALGLCQFVGCGAPGEPHDAVHRWRINGTVVAGILLTPNVPAPQLQTFALCLDHTPLAEQVFGADRITRLA